MIERAQGKGRQRERKERNTNYGKNEKRKSGQNVTNGKGIEKVVVWKVLTR